MVVTEDWESCIRGADVVVEASRLDKPTPLLKTEYDGEQPAHTRVQAVVCAQADQSQPGPHLR